MNANALDKFGEFLMRRVRDNAIIDWQIRLSGRSRAVGAQEIFQRVEKLKGKERELMLDLMEQMVDTTLHHLLWSVEQEESVNLSIQDDGKIVHVSEISDGLPGELYTEDGWIQRFSQESLLKKS